MALLPAHHAGKLCFHGCVLGPQGCAARAVSGPAATAAAAVAGATIAGDFAAGSRGTANAYFKIFVLAAQIVLGGISALQVWRLQRVPIDQLLSPA